ncbi:MAG TPA: tetratricopeptide repeat protein [Polyangia bacterium]|jgi:TolA-binding protein|nr:tetratricopeptide repeat protein [Polyangia bacterium]
MKIKKLKADDLDASPARRWVERTPGGSAPEDRLVSLMRRAEHNRGLDPAVRSRVLRRLNTTASRRDSAAPMLRWGLVAFVLLSSGGVVASVGLGRWWRPVPAAAPAVPQVRPATKAPRSARRQLPQGQDPVSDSALAPIGAPQEEAAAELPAPSPIAAPVAPPTSVVVAAEPRRRPAATVRLARNSVSRPAPSPAMPAPAAIEPPAPALAERPVAAPAATPAPRAVPPRLMLEPPPTRATLPMPSPLSVEAQLIRSAVVRLRRDRDAAGALAELDIYLARFPRGTLQHEARIARADALLSLKRDGEALQALEDVNLGPQGRDQELRVIRGELGSISHCTQAIADFTQVLAATPPAPLAERALYGRAACRVRQGDSEGAVRDLTAYLRRFPAGRFAAEARAAKAAVEN